jgi:hypothetical protein
MTSVDVRRTMIIREPLSGLRVCRMVRIASTEWRDIKKNAWGELTMYSLTSSLVPYS